MSSALGELLNAKRGVVRFCPIPCPTNVITRPTVVHDIAEAHVCIHLSKGRKPKEDEDDFGE